MTEKNKNLSIPLPNETPRDYVSLETGSENYVSLENNSSEKTSYSDLLNSQKALESMPNNANQSSKIKPQQSSENKNEFVKFLGLQYSPETNKVKQTPLAQRLLGNFDFFKQKQENTPNRNLKNDIAFPVKETTESTVAPNNSSAPVAPSNSSAPVTPSNSSAPVAPNNSSAPNTPQGKLNDIAFPVKETTESTVAPNNSSAPNTPKTGGLLGAGNSVAGYDSRPKTGGLLEAGNSVAGYDSSQGKLNDIAFPVKETTESTITPSNSSAPVAPSNSSAPVAPNNSSAPVAPSNSSAPNTPQGKLNDIAFPVKETTESTITPSNSSAPNTPKTGGLLGAGSSVSGYDSTRKPGGLLGAGNSVAGYDSSQGKLNDIAFPVKETTESTVAPSNSSAPVAPNNSSAPNTPQGKFLGIRNEQGMPVTPQNSAYQTITEKLKERAEQNRQSGRSTAFSRSEASDIYRDIAKAKNFDKQNVNAAKENNLPPEISGEKSENFIGNLKSNFLKSSLETPDMNPYKKAVLAVSSKTAQDNFLGIRNEQGMPITPPNNVGSSSSTNSVASPPSNKRQRNDTVLQVSLTRMSYPLWMIQGLVG